MEIYVEPLEVHTTQVVHKIAVSVHSVELFLKASLRIVYYDLYGSEITHPSLPRFIDLTSEEYASWGSDDQFITEQVFQKLQLNPIPPPEPPTPPSTSPTNIIEYPDYRV